MAEVILDVLLDTLKILPFLLLTYVVMEYLEHRMSGRAAGYLAQAEAKGPLIGAAVGVIPQCGFSATAAGFYSGGLITAGTLLAVFLSTSDEMIPVLLGSSIPVGRILKILAWKVVIACISGFAADFWLKNKGVRTMPGERIDELCHEDNCSCGAHNAGIFRPALRHTLKTTLFIFAVSLAAGTAIYFVGEDVISSFLTGRPYAGVFLTALVGLIPNCAASVMITTLFADGLITTGQLMAGLLVSAGVGVAVLLRNNRHAAENARIIGLLYGFGVFWGSFLTLLGVNL